MAPRVCVLTTSYPRWKDDEASVFVGRLVDAFSDEELSGFVITPIDKDEERSSAQGNFEVVRYLYGFFSRGRLAYGRGILQNLKQDPLVFLQIPGFLLAMFYQAYRRRDKWDLIHANWIVSGFVACFLSLCTGKPYVITVRGVDAKLMNLVGTRWLWRIVLRRASAIISVNDAFVKDLAQSDSSLNALYTIPNGTRRADISDAALRDFQTDLSFLSNAPLLLYLGRVIPLKRIERLIELLAEEPLQTASLLLVGRYEEPYRKSLEELAQKLAVSERVHFEGPIAADRIDYYLKTATIYLSASEHEGRSNSLLEALSAGVPVVASDIDGHREMVEDGKNGLLFSDEEPRSKIAGRIAALIQDSQSYQQMSRAAQESVQEYTWENAAKNYSRLFSDVLQRKAFVP